MPRKIKVVVLAIIVIVLGSFLYLSVSKDNMPANGSMQTADSQSSELSSTPKIVNTPDPEQRESRQTTGKYLDYNEGLIGNTEGTTLLFFHAPWCPQCRDLDADIRSSGVPNGVTIIKVDYDSRQDLRQRYGVTIQTTVVKVDSQGNLMQKYVAYDDPSLSAVKANLL